MYFCLDLCVAHLSRPWPTSFHPLTLRSLPACLRMDTRGGGWIHNAQSIGNTPTTLPFIHPPSMGKQQQSQSLHYNATVPDPSFWKNDHHHSSLLCLYLQVVSPSFHICPVLSHSLALLPNSQPPLNIFVGSYGDTWPFFFSALSFLTCLLTIIIFLFYLQCFVPFFLRIHWKWRGGKAVDRVEFFHLLFYFFFFSSFLFSFTFFLHDCYDYGIALYHIISYQNE